MCPFSGLFGGFQAADGVSVFGLVRRISGADGVSVFGPALEWHISGRHGRVSFGTGTCLVEF